MQADIGELLKLLFPVIFLVIWALSSLFNRESRPVPRANPGMGPRPIGPPSGPRPIERPSPPAPARLGTKGDEDILIIRPETLRAQQRSTQAASAARRQSRPKPAPSTASRRSETTPLRPLNTQSGLYMPTQTVGQTVDVQPLAKQSVHVPQSTAGGVASGTAAKIEPARQSQLLRSLTAGPDTLRSAFILSEVLQPPLAMRPRRRV